MMRRRKI